MGSTHINACRCVLWVCFILGYYIYGCSSLIIRGVPRGSAARIQSLSGFIVEQELGRSRMIREQELG